VPDNQARVFADRIARHLVGPSQEQEKEFRILTGLSFDEVVDIQVAIQHATEHAKVFLLIGEQVQKTLDKLDSVLKKAYHLSDPEATVGSFVEEYSGPDVRAEQSMAQMVSEIIGLRAPAGSPAAVRGKVFSLLHQEVAKAVRALEAARWAWAERCSGIRPRKTKRLLRADEKSQQVEIAALVIYEILKLKEVSHRRRKAAFVMYFLGHYHVPPRKKRVEGDPACRFFKRKLENAQDHYTEAREFILTGSSVMRS